MINSNSNINSEKILIFVVTCSKSTGRQLIESQLIQPVIIDKIYLFAYENHDKLILVSYYLNIIIKKFKNNFKR